MNDRAEDSPPMLDTARAPWFLRSDVRCVDEPAGTGGARRISAPVVDENDMGGFR